MYIRPFFEPLLVALTPLSMCGCTRLRKWSRVSSVAFVGQLTTFVTGAFSLMAALAWNAAVHDSLERFESGPAGRFGYAVLITAIATVVVLSTALLNDTYKGYLGEEKATLLELRTVHRGGKAAQL